MKLPNSFLLRILEIKEDSIKSSQLNSQTSIKEEAFKNMHTFLYAVEQFDENIPLPDLFMGNDGALEMNWEKNGNGILVYVYGDNIVHFDFRWGTSNHMSGSCALSDNILLNLFIEVLCDLLKEKKINVISCVFYR